MKRILLTIALVLIAAISFAQTTKNIYNVYRVVHQDLNLGTMDFENSREIEISSGIQVTMYHSNININNQFNTNIVMSGNFKSEDTENIKMLSWIGIDNDKDKVICYIILYRKEKETQLILVHNTDVLRYYIKPL